MVSDVILIGITVTKLFYLKVPSIKMEHQI